MSQHDGRVTKIIRTLAGRGGIYLVDPDQDKRKDALSPRSKTTLASCCGSRVFTKDGKFVAAHGVNLGTNEYHSVQEYMFNGYICAFVGLDKKGIEFQDFLPEKEKAPRHFFTIKEEDSLVTLTYVDA